MSISIFPHMIRRETALEPLTIEELNTIKLFQEKALNVANAKRLQNSNPFCSFLINRADKSVESFESNTPEIEKIEVLALRFRFFFAEKEPTHVFKILNLLTRKAKDDWAKNYIAYLRSWHKDFLSRTNTSQAFGQPTKNEEIINLWFNAEFFHQDPDKKRQLDELNSSISKEASLFQLNTGLRLCISNIENIYTVIHKITETHQFICTPNHHFQRKA
ncbi:MAG: hypothetical protein Q7K57_09980 [Burkholderiaceae bacterium]|nr:hypothetical protein [Burkholderiaceae bacterium]